MPSESPTTPPPDDATPLIQNSASLTAAFDAAQVNAPFVPPAGGDFHAAFPMEGGKVGVVMGDVAGHGPQAAMHADTLRRALTDSLQEGLSPKETLGFINAATEMSPDFEGFATVFAGTITPDGTIEYASGGHEPALIASPAPVSAEDSDATVKELDTTGPPLGAIGADEIQYEQKTAALPEGGTLLLYTDGITEARRGRTFFGEERLRLLLQRFAHLPPLALARKILGQARAFAGRGTRLRDDAALLAVRRRKPRP